MIKGYIPVNLNLASIKRPDKIIYILTRIYYGRVLNETHSINSFIPLSAKILRFIMYDYKTPLSYLICNGIIETNNRYIVGTSSKGFRLTSLYALTDFKQVEIQDKRIINKITKYKNKQAEEMRTIQHKHIWNCLNQIKIDSDRARKFIENAELDAERYFSYSMSIEMIEAGTWFQTVDSTAGRVHNNITNLSRNLRPFLKYEGQNLIEIDIANSQPFLFNILINNYLNNHVSISNRNINLSYDVGFEKYKELTSKGLFYEYLMKELDISEDRSLFKVRFFQKIFYGRENPNYVSKERKQFTKLFPNESEIISFYKKDDYRQLAIKLQRAEADIMINTIVPVLAAKGIFLLTIHDSILTTPGNAEIVKQVILDEFQTQYGLIPTLKIKGV